MKILSEKEFNQRRRDKNRVVYSFDVGGVWEDNDFRIELDTPIYEADLFLCPHLTEKYAVRYTRADNTEYNTIYANCPRVVIATNEGGNNSTGVCLDCILEAVKKLNL